MKKEQGFSLIELVVVISIIAVLASLLFPVVGAMRLKADSTACTSNLRQIGLAVLIAAGDNDNRFPYIETDVQNPVYPPEIEAKGLLETLLPYGLGEKNVQCPADLKQADFFAQKGTSYEWRPMIDGETVVNPTIYTRFGAIPASPSRIRLAMDYDRIHSGRMNLLYADGHVRGF